MLTGRDTGAHLSPVGAADRSPHARLLHRSRSAGISVEVWEDACSRWLAFGDGTVQSLMDRRRPHELSLAYSRAMMAFLLFLDAPAEILLLGLGGGSMARFLLRHLPRGRITVVESEPRVAEAARRYFSLPVRDPRLRVEVADARDFVARDGGCYDAALVDLYTASGMPDWVTDDGFLGDCRRRLGGSGLLGINLWASGEPVFLGAMESLRVAFDGRTVCVPVDGYQNLVVLGFASTPPYSAIDTLSGRATDLGRRTGMDFERLVADLQAANSTHAGQLLICNC